MEADVNRLKNLSTNLALENKKLKDRLKYFDSRFAECTYECEKEKRDKCIMYPEYCDGTKAEYVDIETLIDKGLESGNIH